MVVLIVEKAPASTRGEISRLLPEYKHGVFIGYVNARVRDKLWERVEGKGLSAIMVYSSNTAQGFRVRMCGDPERELFDADGILLPCIVKYKKYRNPLTKQ